MPRHWGRGWSFSPPESRPSQCCKAPSGVRPLDRPNCQLAIRETGRAKTGYHSPVEVRMSRVACPAHAGASVSVHIGYVWEWANREGKMGAKKRDAESQMEAKPAAPLAADKLKSKEYERALAELQVELVKLQLWVVEKGLKVCVVFEGRDGAGKGGVIKAITERVSPRVFRVVALPAPTEREKSQMYLQRYMQHLPAAGEIVIFDRSWYNRAGVERIMGFCSMDGVRRFLNMTPGVEKAFVDSGIVLLKYWLEVSQEEQQRRLEARINDPRKIWKLSPMDLKSYGRWYDYSRARA